MDNIENIRNFANVQWNEGLEKSSSFYFNKVYMEDHLNRDEEDFELEVGSAGLGQPFKVPQQYINFVGKEVEVLDADGKKVKGILKAVDGNDFTVGVEEKVKVEGKKRPVKQEVDYAFQMDKVKYTKYVISFK